VSALEAAGLQPSGFAFVWGTSAMHRALGVITLFCFTGAAEAAPPKVEPAKYGWHTDFAAAKAEAKRTGKPMMLVFRCEP
jgi:hypothetical protein